MGLAVKGLRSGESGRIVASTLSPSESLSFAGGSAAKGSRMPMYLFLVSRVEGLGKRSSSTLLCPESHPLLASLK